MTSLRRSHWLSLTTFMCLGALALLPSTGWIVRQQLLVGAMLLPPRVSALLYGDHSERRRAEVVQQQADDVVIQIAGADGDVAALEALVPRFPNSPAVQGAILRALSENRMNLDGRTTDQAQIRWPRESVDRDKQTVTAETLRLWNEAATSGERLDPTNGFFPFLHAAGLFALHRDDEACAEVIRAGGASHYDEYHSDEIEGRWRLADAANRVESGSIAKLAILSSTLETHQLVTHSVARLAIVQAISLEQSGRAESGFAIRQAVERFGARMRTDSSALEGSKSAEIICSFARARPGGAPAPPLDPQQTNYARSAQSVVRYADYLRKIGHSEEIAWIEHDLAVQPVLHRISVGGLDVDPMRGLIELAALWAVSSLLLGNLFFVLISGGIAALLCRTATVRHDLPLKPFAILGILAAIVLTLGYLIYSALPVLQTYLNASLGQAAGVLPFLTVAAQVTFWTVDHRCRKRKVTGQFATVRGYAANALPAATVLALLYIPLILVTGRIEAARLDALRQIARHEGHAYARMEGVAWPTYAPETTK